MKNVMMTVTGLLVLLMLGGCLPQNGEEEEQEVIVVEDTEEGETEFGFTPTVDSDGVYFRTVLQDGVYFRSDARGAVNDAFNNRVDLDQLETGLMEIASGFYSPDDFYLTEGQHLSGNLINSWLNRANPLDQTTENDEGEAVYDPGPGLNPGVAEENPGSVEAQADQMREAPLMISHIMEHNYWTGSGEDGVELEGIVIGIGLRAVYYFNTRNEDGTINFYEQTLDREEVQAYGREQAQVILNRLRSESFESIPNDVPITFALYQEEPRGAVAPGGFTAMTHVAGGSLQIDGWETVNERFVVFPSGEARSYDANLANQMSQFREETEDFFDRKIGAVGTARYRDDILEEMTIELNLQSHGQAEIIALSQFISDRLAELITVQVPVRVYIESVSGMEAIIIQHPDEEPFMHILR
ncbi:CamS family sex pheromone protein [Salisediminibacterium selenitireducens]|uniref:CamS sex pheromone cAM373 family protein n=1 Tax=Bacillus selenitireducens (strain ATCC 700615 / DSM 15326 / MLS10) TaxID=439292 RepID=D6XYW4_BACIE|nr:CamS family sex pheromone protein [Salisediminibacterium selenitireducens]ADH98272.1 CamS sex pheromone cAM373 family protein [[Bacillus] selenitireducens MLS10]